MDEMNQKPDDYISVQKALEILLAFTPHNREMGTMELSHNLGYHKSTVSRLLRVLTYYGFVQHDPTKRKYMLGISAANIGKAIRQSLSEHLIGIAQPYIDDLRNRIGKTVGLEVWSGKGTILAYRAKGPHHMHPTPRLGVKIPVHISAGARAILAYSPPEFVDTVLHGKFERFTPNTITDPNIIKNQLNDVRKAGVAFTHGEKNIDVDVIAAPIFNHEKRPLAAVNTSATVSEMESMRGSGAVSSLKETAATISSKLLYSEDRD